MRGHVLQRSSTWTFVVDIGRDETGKRKQKTKGGFRTKRDAQRALRETLQALDRGDYVESSSQTLAAFLTDEWLPAIATRVRPGTANYYRQYVLRYAFPRLGGVALERVTPAMLHELYDELLARGGSRAPAGLSPVTVQHLHRVLHKAMSDAVRWGRLARNPVQLVDPPRGRSPEMRVWTAEQLRQFLAHVEKDRLYGAWLLAGTTGLRRGELLGLRWADANLEANRLSIRQTLTVVNGQALVSETKTAKGRRSVSLDPETVAGLRAHRARQLEERLAWGPAWQDTGLVFTREDGSMVHPTFLTKRFGRLAREAGLPPIRFHDVRHSYATAALEAGVPAKVVSARLGHATVSITLDTYSHVLPSLDEQAAATVARRILGDS